MAAGSATAQLFVEDAVSVSIHYWEAHLFPYSPKINALLGVSRGQLKEVTELLGSFNAHDEAL